MKTGFLYQKEFNRGKVKTKGILSRRNLEEKFLKKDSRDFF